MDSDLFVSAKKIIAALQNQSCTEALQWCNENKTALRKNKVLEWLLDQQF